MTDSLELIQALAMSIPPAIQQLFTPGVTDVLITGPMNCSIDRGSGLEHVSVDFGSEENLRRLAIELALGAGSRADIAKPISDFSIGNFRCQVVLPFGVSTQTLISIRKHPGQQVTLDHLVEAEMLNLNQSEFLARSVRDRKTIIVTGATGSGKTTLLSALVHLANERTICIEQTPELQPSFPSVGLLEREPNQEGAGGVDTVELLSHALRMRPDRLAIGEVRGREFGALLLAINNGHSAMATLHAESLSALPRRLNLLGHMAGLHPAIAGEMLRSIDLVVQLSNLGTRRIEVIARLEIQAGSIVGVPIEV